MRTVMKTIPLLLIATCGICSATAPSFAQSGAPKAHARSTAATSRSQEARHQDCLAFIERHGLSCDPWKEPTCGYDLGIARPLSCVAP